MKKTITIVLLLAAVLAIAQVSNMHIFDRPAKFYYWAQFGGDIYPNWNKKWDLGKSTLKWDSLWVRIATVDSLSVEHLEVSGGIKMLLWGLNASLRYVANDFGFGISWWYPNKLHYGAPRHQFDTKGLMASDPDSLVIDSTGIAGYGTATQLKGFTIGTIKNDSTTIGAIFDRHDSLFIAIHNDTFVLTTRKPK